MAFTIMISDEQRLALLALIDSAPAVSALDAPLEYWPAMLAELPAVEADHPGCLHGFCL